MMSGPTVTIHEGKLLGKISKNILGNFFYSFQGIPYAKPPLGDLRFKAPQPPDAWIGIRNATKEGSVCCHRDVFSKKVVGSEDCLFLNVYTRQLPPKVNFKLKPVMVWIHGGAFKYGSGNSDLYGPEYLLTEDIVLVTINYRLGIFGFLSFEDISLGVCGNAGLKDMVMALKWIQKNINNFAGDPNNVTIFGESAGAAAVHYLVLSPTAKGLFHKAIAQSGCALNIYARGKQQPLGQLATDLHLSATSTERKVLNRLSTLNAETLLELQEKYVILCDIHNNSGERRPYSPIIEKPSEEAFIIDEPIKIIQSGNYNKVPIIFGYNTREGMFVEAMIKPKKPEMPKDFEKIIPFMLEVPPGSKLSEKIANQIKNFYYGELGSENGIDNFYLLHTDNYVLRDIVCAVKQHVLTSPFPVYLYRMSIETNLNIYKKLNKITAPGVTHGDDIGYLFKTKFSPEFKEGTLEDISVKRFVKFWTNFAKYGNPNFFEDSNNIEWKSVKKDKLNFIDIGKNLTAGLDPESERMKFWNNVFRMSSHL